MTDYPLTAVPDDPDNGHISANDALGEVRDLQNGDAEIDCGAGGTIVVSDADAGKFFIRLAAGSPAVGAAFTVDLPNYERFLLIQNDTDEIATIDTAVGAAATVAIPPGGRRLIKVSGTGATIAVVGLNIYDLGFFFAGLPETAGSPAAGSLLARLIAVRPFVLTAGLPEAQGFAGTAPSDGAVAIDIHKNDSSIGSVNFAMGDQDATFTFASDVSFAVGDRLSFYAPDTQDSTFADISVTLSAVRAG